MKTFTLYHLNPNIKTLEDFCCLNGVYFDSKDSKKQDKYTIEDFFNDSRESILSQMTDKDKKKYIIENSLGISVKGLTAGDLKFDMTLPCPLKLVVDNRFVTYTLTAKHNTFQAAVTDVNAFEDAQIRGSISEDVIKYKGSYKKKAKCSVIGFFKSLYYQKQGNNSLDDVILDNVYQLQTDFTDISNFIISLSTNMSVSGGSFSFQLPHIPFQHKYSTYASYMGSDISKNDGISKIINVDSFDEMYRYNSSKGYPLVKGDMNTMDYWVWLISSNDLIFISFDEIGGIQNDNLAGKSYDMIGLVEEVSISRDSNGNITVTVSGKDLLKLLQDDSALYFPCSITYNQGNLFDNTEAAESGDVAAVMTVNGKVREVNDDMLRIPSPDSNALISLFKLENNGLPIDYIIKVIVSALANTQICPSEIFSSWGERVTTFAYLTPAENKNNQTNK